MRILVVGGAGYVGSHMCRLLAEHGHAVTVLDDLSTGHVESVQWGTLERGDLGDGQTVDRVFERVRPEAVMHFAARSLVGESMREPQLYYRNNVAATLTLLDRVRREPGCLFVFSSTAAIFGEPRQALIAESHPKAPINPYGRSKLMVETMLADEWAAHRLPSVCLRYFNAAGAEPQARIGEAHQPETHLIPRMLDAVLGRSEPVSLFGTDYPTPDGTCIRDYVHVDDLGHAHLLALEHLREQPGHYCFNLGNGAGYSVHEVLSAGREVVGREVPMRVAERRAGDPERLVADASLARSVLGWTPRTPGLMEIIESAWRWHRQRRF
jgi:UDP-galactose 4-epimerase (EC 5.1.3.2)